MPYAVTIPGNPIPKARARVVRGHAFTPLPTVIYEKKVKLAAIQAGIRPILGNVSLQVVFFRENNRRCDLDNLIKSIKDGLNGVAWNDDSQVTRLVAFKTVDKEAPRASVLVESCGDFVPSFLHGTTRKTEENISGARNSNTER